MKTFNMEWTPTSKRKPYVNEKVIISTIYNTIYIATYRYFQGDYWSNPFYYYDTECSDYDIKNNILHLPDDYVSFKENEIVAWMLAPKPYKMI